MKKTSLSSRGAKLTETSEFIAPIMECLSNPDVYTNLGVAGNVLMNPETKQRLESIAKDDLISTSSFQYGDFTGSEKLKEHFAHYFNYSFGKPIGKDFVSPENIVVGGGANVILDQLAFGLLNDDDFMVIDSPLYLAFETDFKRRSNVNVLSVYSGEKDGRLVNYRMNTKELRKVFEQYKDKTIGYVLCNPHNPTGRVYTDEEIWEITDLCLEYGVHLISDEVYGNSILTDTPIFKSLLYFMAHASEDKLEKMKTYVHICYSLSKDFGLNGYRVGFLVSFNEELLALFGNMGDMNTVSRLTLDLMEKHFSDKRWISTFVKENSYRMRYALKKVCELFDKFKVPYVEPDAGMFIWFCLEKYQIRGGFKDEDELFWYIFKECKILFGRGRLFLENEKCWFRCCFTSEILTKQLHALQFMMEKLEQLQR